MNLEEKRLILTKKSELLKIIAHPMRLCILNCLLESSCNVTKLVNMMNVPQSTVSQHLAKLRISGIITGTRNGVEVKYTVTHPDVIRIIDLFIHDDIEVLEINSQIN